MKNLKKYFLATLACMLMLSGSVFGMDDRSGNDFPRDSFPNQGDGMVIILNGTSSSGKSTIARRLYNLMGLINWEYLALDALKYKGLEINDLDEDEYDEFDEKYGNTENLEDINCCLCERN